MEPDRPTITEAPTGEFHVIADEDWVAVTGPRGRDIYRVVIPRDVMLTFLGEFSEKVLKLRMDAMKQARETRDRLEVTRALPHTGLCVDDHCYCPKASRQDKVTSAVGVHRQRCTEAACELGCSLGGRG